MPDNITNVIFFIGGGADKTRERFGIFHWGPTHLMAHAKQYFEKIQGPCSTTEYYGYLDKKAILEKIFMLRCKHPQLRINLVGHSRGACVAKEIATKKSIPINLLITLDPVKESVRHKYSIPNKEGISNIEQFISVFAKPKHREAADYLALVGGQYGHRLKISAHHFVQVDVGHAYPIAMLQSTIDNQGKTLFDLLRSESFK